MKVIQIKPFRFGPTQCKLEVERLRREGRMPSLEELLSAIEETRRIYVPQILSSRKTTGRGKRKEAE